jgi:hypothetical protein
MHEWLAQVGREVGGVVLREAVQALGEGVVAASWSVRASAHDRRGSARRAREGSPSEEDDGPATTRLRTTRFSHEMTRTLTMTTMRMARDAM